MHPFEQDRRFLSDAPLRPMSTLVTVVLLLWISTTAGASALAAPDDQIAAGASADRSFEAAGMTPAQVARLRIIRSALISPDGAATAALREAPRCPLEGEDGPAWTELLKIDRTTGTALPFVTGEVDVSAIDWLPDSSAISFLAKRDGDEATSLYLIPIDGGEARRVVGLSSDIRAYSWSPDGRQVAVIAAEPMSQELQEARDHGFNQQVFEEDWRPLRVWIAQRGSASPPNALPLEGSAFQVRWSPDGAALAVALAPRPLVDDRYMLQRVHIVAAENGQPLAQINNPGKLGRFEWSPDGTKIAMISGADLHDPAAGSLLVAPRRGGMPTSLTAGCQCRVEDLAWKDAETIIYLASEGTTTRLYSIRPDGSGQKVLADSPPNAILTSISLDADGTTAAFVADSPAHPAELFSGELGGPIGRRTSSNPWLEELSLARQEVVRYPASDGLEIEGILIYPLGFTQERRYPLVVIAHGGPEGHYHNGWLTRYNRPGQVLAARGFLVLYPNYRGSTGRGVVFSKLGQADAAGAEFTDLVDGVDHLIKLGLVDPDHVGITGASYGGYATAWCATRFTERFAAGVMFAGISDKVSKAGTTDIPQEEFLVHARALPHENLELFYQRSPIAHAAGSRTPLLIAHGTADTRVHPGQALEMYRALRMAGQAPVRLVLYPGEGHGNRRAASRLDLNLRQIRWLEHYLKGPGGDPPPYPIDHSSPDHGWDETAGNR